MLTQEQSCLQMNCWCLETASCRVFWMSIREERWRLGMVSSGQNGRTFSGSCLQHTSWHIECSFQINVTFLPCPCSGVIFFLSQYGLKLGLFLLQRHCFCNLPPLQLLCIGEG
jgi:hypothetical protein